MKKSMLYLGFVISSLAACGTTSQQQTAEQFQGEAVVSLKKAAKTYSEEALQNGEVPLHEFLSLSGEIMKSDGKGSQVKKGDRFILKSGSSQYQIFNEQEMQLEVGEQVTVYGEYYGFIKGLLIERDVEK